MENLKRILKKEIKELRETTYRKQNSDRDGDFRKGYYNLKLIMTKKQIENGYGTIRFDYYQNELEEIKTYLKNKYNNLNITDIQMINGFNGLSYRVLKISYK